MAETNVIEMVPMSSGAAATESIEQLSRFQYAKLYCQVIWRRWYVQYAVKVVKLLVAIWVICDGNGNWARIHNRLKLQNLKFEGSKVHI